MGSYKKIGLSHEMGLIDTPPLTKLHRYVKHNEKVCRAYDLGSCAQSQGRNQVRGQNRVSAITQKLQKQILGNYIER